MLIYTRISKKRNVLFIFLLTLSLWVTDATVYYLSQAYVRCICWELFPGYMLNRHY